ncbi:MAG: glycan-binding surface protein [bacterium]|nr:glycan-binding surface protein [bacterium]
MRLKKYLIVVLSTIVFLSCEEDDGVGIQDPNGEPLISYVRVANPDQSDSLLVRANLGSEIVLIGSNLGGIREVWFNDQQASLTPTWVTNETIFVQVPNSAPNEVTDIIYLIDEDSDTLKYPFEVSISAPVISSAVNEWPQAGENLVIDGNFFFEPAVITYTGGVAGEVVSISQERIEFTVPEGAIEGPVTVTTNFGEVESGFHLWDSRNTVLNFDDLQPNGWRIGAPETGDGELDGNYNVFRGNLDANVRDEGPGSPANSPLLFEYWGGADASRTDNFYPDFSGSYREYVLKFEAKVNNWYGGHLNICLAPSDHIDSNQEIWSNDINARAIWAPWEDEDATFDTNGQWITVVVPLTSFEYHMGNNDDQGTFYTPGQDFIESAAGSISMWLLGSPENDGNAIEFYVDNIRFVEL